MRTLPRSGRGLAAAGVSVVLAVATVTLATSGTAGAAPGCRVDYGASDWGGGGGFTANLRVTNVGDPVAGWTLMPDAPLSGHWFPAQLQELMRNAFPPL